MKRYHRSIHAKRSDAAVKMKLDDIICLISKELELLESAEYDDVLELRVVYKAALNNFKYIVKQLNQALKGR